MYSDIFRYFLDVFRYTPECCGFLRFLTFMFCSSQHLWQAARGWDISNMMCLGLAGGSGLEQAIVDADAEMPPEGLPVASERQVVRADALGSNERQGK